MSYVRMDDAHENGRLSQFRERLSGEVRMQTGEAFEIFQDRNDIAWGQQWQQRIDGALDAVTFLIPVITPAFFKSPACREEFERFLKREESLSRKDLILPVYYVECPVLSNEARRETDSIAKVIASRQFADWRELRFEPFTTPDVGRRLASIAKQIVVALERDEASVHSAIRPTITPQPSEIESDKIEAGFSSEVSERPTGPSPKTKVPTITVDAFHRGDYASLTEALKAAKPGTRILVRPGLYREGLVIDKPVEIVGDGDRSDIVFEAVGKDVVLFKSSMGRITNLTLRQMGGEGKWYCVDIAQGRLDLEDSDITSQGGACVAIHDGADPRLRRNIIHDGNTTGVFVYTKGKGTLEENEIYGNTLAGVEIKDGGNPTLRRNLIHDGKAGGIYVHTNGQGVLEENEIYGNILTGVEIKTGGNPVLRRNRIHDGKQSGVYVHTNGQGVLEENEIFGNEYAGVTIRENGNPVLHRNQITNNKFAAIRVHESGGGTFEENDLRGNAKGAWLISPDSESKVVRKGNIED
jgi:parallel beta-helix repeat protein